MTTQALTVACLCAAWCRTCDAYRAVFDAAVNSGVRQAVKWLQRAVGVADDGVIGHKTLSAIVAMEPYKLTAVFNGQRLKFMTELETFGRFGKGWSRRIAENLINLP